MVFVNVIALRIKLLNFDCIDGCRSRSRILKFENISDPDLDSKILKEEQSRSLKL